MEEALRIGERLRAAFGLMRFPGVAPCATVSVGALSRQGRRAQPRRPGAAGGA
jgi:hypothetical protein